MQNFDETSVPLSLCYLVMRPYFFKQFINSGCITDNLETDYSLENSLLLLLLIGYDILIPLKNVDLKFRNSKQFLFCVNKI